jgi:hypothetical protein
LGKKREDAAANSNSSLSLQRAREHGRHATSEVANRAPDLGVHERILLHL